MEDFVFRAQNHYDIIIVAVLSIGITIFLSKAWRGTASDKAGIPGRLGLPFLGETLSFLSANNSTRGCYDFVRLRRLWLVIFFGPIYFFFVNHDVMLSKLVAWILTASTSETTYTGTNEKKIYV